MPRCKPTILPSGRILLPLYSDTFSIGIMAVSDDGGDHWYASKPLIGVGAIQPTVLRRDDGTLVAYMRENGVTEHIRVSESKDDGITWGPVGVIDLPNPGRRHRRRSAGQRPLAAGLQRHDQRSQQPGGFDLRR